MLIHNTALTMRGKRPNWLLGVLIPTSYILGGLFEYNPRFKYGGIKDLRETFSQDKVSNTAIEYDIPLIKEQLEIELEKIRNEYDTSNDREYRKYLAKMINDFQYEIKKLNDTEYTKRIKYSDIQDLQERIQEVVDDINEE